MLNKNDLQGLKNPNVDDPVSSIYVHVPFCRSKCGYCDYYSLGSGRADFAAFAAGIKQELDITLAYLEQKGVPLAPLKSLYFGGGTPSALPAEVMAGFLDLFKERLVFSPEAEVTMEVNPEGSGQETVRRAIAGGVNRISLGYQAKQDRLLKKIGRIHSYQDFRSMLDLVRSLGITNISCDLMFGLPDQDLADVLDSALDLVSLEIPHISFYSLILEPGTRFYRTYAKRPDLLLSEDLERRMYHDLVAYFQGQGFRYYELSSAARPGFYSRHNYNYWTGRPYLGLGPGAHGYFNGLRKGNIRSLNRWLEEPWESAEIEEISGELAVREYAMLAFRLDRGFSPGDFQERFGLVNPFEEELAGLEARKLIYWDGPGASYKLSQLGLDFANQVFMEFL